MCFGVLFSFPGSSYLQLRLCEKLLNRIQGRTLGRLFVICSNIVPETCMLSPITIHSLEEWGIFKSPHLSMALDFCFLAVSPIPEFQSLNKITERTDSKGGASCQKYNRRFSTHYLSLSNDVGN